MFLWITDGTFFGHVRLIKCSTQVPNLSPHRFGFTYPQQTSHLLQGVLNTGRLSLFKAVDRG